MWTINDFPASGMLFGWSTHGKLAYPYCIENNKAFMLTNGGKTSFFYYHRRFLPHNHKYIKNRKDFFVGRVEKDVASPSLSGEELHDVVSDYGDILFGLQSCKQKFPGFGLTHNWVKRSIFWELPYWKTNLLRHNLDVIHIEKNMFENIFNTVMDRLQRLFMSPRIVEHMTWHQSHDAIDGVMVHPSDGEAWKHFNNVHPHFSAESRNVRLGLCTDGFNPFGSFAHQSTVEDKHLYSSPDCLDRV